MWLIWYLFYAVVGIVYLVAIVFGLGRSQRDFPVWLRAIVLGGFVVFGTYGVHGYWRDSLIYDVKPGDTMSFSERSSTPLFGITLVGAPDEKSEVSGGKVGGRYLGLSDVSLTVLGKSTVGDQRFLVSASGRWLPAGTHTYLVSDSDLAEIKHMSKKESKRRAAEAAQAAAISLEAAAARVKS